MVMLEEVKMQEEFLQIMDDYLQLKDRITIVLLLIDFRVGPTEDDLVMLNYLLETTTISNYFNES